MPARFILSLIILISVEVFAQRQFLSVGILARLDSISMSAGKESHFAELYLNTAISADSYIEMLPEQGKILMRKLEQNFAEYFFRTVDSNSKGSSIPKEWKNYFNGKDLSELQLKLMGANAHINGDIWQAMVSSFSLEEIKLLKPYYKRYNKSIATVFNDLYIVAIESDKRLRNLHSLSFGADKVYGKMMLKKWRNRQLKLAVFSYSNPKKFNRLRKRIDAKMKRIDKMIITKLH